MNNNDLDLLKSSIREYINIIIATTMPYVEKHNLNKDFSGNDLLSVNLKVLQNIDYMLVNTIHDKKLALELKDEVVKVEKNINNIIHKDNIILSPREQALVDRGYNIDDVKKLVYVNDKSMEEIANNVYDMITKDCKPSIQPNCIFLGGQPGCGKSSRSMNIKSQYKENNDPYGIVEIGIDNYRAFHPNYLEMEQLIKKHWENKTPTKNDSPGNVIADFTHSFAGKLEDILIDKVSNKKYNIALEWGMREPTGPLNVMHQLKDKNYKNDVEFIVVDKNTSLEACNIRADIMNNQNHIIRRVPDSFHELCISTLPDSCDEIYKIGYLKDKIIDDFKLVNRLGNILWDKNNNINPGITYKTYLNNTKTNSYNDSKYALKSYEIESTAINNDLNKMLEEKPINNIETLDDYKQK